MPSTESREHWRNAAFALPAALVMAAVFAVPLGAILYQSVVDQDGAPFTLANFGKMLGSALFLRVAVTTFEISVSATLFSVLLAYPIAYVLAGQPPRRRALLMILVLVPFWTSSLVKSFSFTVLLGQSGIVNQALALVGVPPVKMLFNRFGVVVGMSHYLIPFVVFPVLSSLLARPPELTRAAAIMGAGKLRIFWRVILPLSLPGVMAGALLVFIISLGFYVIPALLGGRQDMMFSNLVDFYAREVLDWPMASAVATVLILVAVLAAMLLSKVRGGASLLADEAAP